MKFIFHEIRLHLCILSADVLILAAIAGLHWSNLFTVQSLGKWVAYIEELSQFV